MANTNYNAYPAVIINEKYQVQTVATDGTLTNASNENFAMKITISEDGTLWVLSFEPDPDGGGAKLYWSKSPNSWNEINSSDPGGMTIAGGSGSDCFFTDGEGSIWIQNTEGKGGKYFAGRTVLEIGAGGGKLWAIYSEEPGDIPSLYYSNWSPPFDFKKFNIGETATPYSISVNYQGNCYAAEDMSPKYYSHDGTSMGSAGSGADGKTLMVSFKNWNYILTTDANEKGNQVMEWQDDQGGIYMATSIRAVKVISTFYRK